MARIEYFVHGRGRGHASRSAPIARRLLDGGHAVRVHGGGDGAALLGSLPGVVAREPLLPGPLAAARMLARARGDRRLLRESRAELVISDGDQGALLAARAEHIPTVAVGHDLVFSSCELPRELSVLAVAYQRLNASVPTHAADRRIAVHFLPVAPRRAATRVARPDSAALPIDAIADDGFILAYFRDANGRDVVEALRVAGRSVHWRGPGAVDVSGRPCPPLSREQFLERLARCTAVVASAGSNLLSECVMLGKPILALHRAGDSEQAMNARWAESARVAVGAPIHQVDQPLVDRFLARVDAGDFARVPLAKELAPVSDVMLETVSELTRQR